MKLDIDNFDFTDDQAVAVSKAAQDCMNAFKTALGDLETMNIIVMGKSGVGKSTLINNIFRGDFAKTGKGKPVTDSIKRITKKDFPMVIYDTPGFELSESQRQEVEDGVLDIIRKGMGTKDAIHCIWYCVQVPGTRFEEEEVKWLRNLSKNEETHDIPIIVVLTKSYDKRDATDMKRAIERARLKIAEVVPVLAEEKVIENTTIPAYGLDYLVDVGPVDKVPNEKRLSAKCTKKWAKKIMFPLG